MRFRSEPADVGKVFQDSGVAVAVPDDQGNVNRLYGVIEKIVDVTLTHATTTVVMLYVRCYRKELVGPDPKCSNVVLIQAEAATWPFIECNVVIRASQVMQQVFFTRVPDVVSLSHPWVWVMRYTSSSYQGVLDDVDEQEEDDDLEPTM